jgi:hypothetical protein
MRSCDEVLHFVGRQSRDLKRFHYVLLKR